MSFQVTNLSSNPLRLSDGKMLAEGATRKMKKVDDTERNFEARRWLRIIEDQPEVKPKEANK